MSDFSIKFDNGIRFELAVSESEFFGIGAVWFGDTPLRSPKLPWTVYTESEVGVRFDRFRLFGVERETDAVTIVFTSEGQWLPRIQAADAMGDSRVKTRRLKNPTATFRWRFHAIVETIEEKTWSGLAMQLSVSSPDAPIHLCSRMSRQSIWNKA